MMKLVINFLLLIVLASCSSSMDSKKQVASDVPSMVKTISLSKSYPGVFSAIDSYVHLPKYEKERDTIISSCSNGNTAATIKNLLAELKDQSKIYVNSYYVATCYAINKDYHRALHYYGKVYSSSPDILLKSKSLANMAFMQWTWGKYRKALAYFRESYSLQANPVTLYHLTSLELELGLYQKVGERRTELAKYNYTDSWWQLLLAESSFFVLDYDKAVVHYETLSADFWQSQNESLSNYLVALYKTGRHEVIKNFMSKWKNKILPSQSYLAVKKIYPEMSKYE